MKTVDLRRKLLPDYSVIPFLLCAVGQLIAYYLSRVINYSFRGMPETFPDIGTDLDRAIPVWPIWSTVYFLSYLFWFISYVWVSRESKEMCNRLLTADMMGKLICAVIFVIFPTTFLRPAVDTSTFDGWLLNFIYQIDQPDNLFPSMHCSVSWFSARFVFKCEKIPKWYKIFAFVAAFMVFASVLFTKQHVIIDIFAGVFVAEACTQIASRTKLHKLYDKLDIGRFYERKEKRRKG